MSTKETYQVAKAMQAKYDEITTLIEAVCKTHLNDEYAALSRKRS